MKKWLQRLELKRKTAAFMAVILATMAFLPYIPKNMVSFADYAQTIEPSAWVSWNPSAYGGEANSKGYTPTGLMYETKDFHLGAAVEEGNFPAGAKQYLVKNNSSTESGYDEFDKIFLYCVAMHSESSRIYLGSQAFFQKYWTVDDMPKEFPDGDNAKVPKLKKFNFLMNIYATHMGRNDSIAACNDANAGTAKYIVAAIINWIAANNCEFTGEWEADLNSFRDSADYRSVIKQMNPNSVGDRSVFNQLTSTQIDSQYAARGCKNWAEWMFGNVWDAATITKQFDVDSEETVYFAKMDHASDTYTITIPYSNDAVKDYYQHLSAKDLYGDWTFTGPTEAGLVFTSMNGEVPSDGKRIATLYWPNQSQIGADLAKDLGSAQLATFKFYTNANDPRNPNRYAFDISQTYFAAKMDKDLEVHVRVGSGSAGTAVVNRYKHTEGFGANYNVGLNAFDSETGKPLADTHWDILEKFDDSQLDSTNLDLRRAGDYSSNLGSLTGASWEEDSGNDEERISLNYDGDTGLNDSESNLYNQGNSSGSQFERWSDPENDPCNADEHITDSNGVLHYVDSRGNIHSEVAHHDSRSYTYQKGYCSGHPAPVVEYEEVPEPEYDEETGEQTNEDEIEAVEEYNQEIHDTAWAKWLEGVKECEDRVKEGGFFHAIDPTGTTQREALEADRDQFYKDFISLNYEYSAKETNPAPGYSLHGSHPDDIPMEWRTVTSSEYKDYNSHGIDHSGGSFSGGGPDMEKDSLSEEAVQVPVPKTGMPDQAGMFVSFGTSNNVAGFEAVTEAIGETEAEVERQSEPEAVKNTEAELVEETQPETTEVTEPETTVAEPETTAAEPETTVAEPETTAVEPETTAAEPETTAAEPETTEAQPETIANPDPVIVKEPVASASEAIIKKTATRSNADRVDGGISFTGFLEGLVSGVKLLASKVQTMANNAASFLSLRSFGDDESDVSGSSLSSLPESTDTSRVDLLDSSMKDWTFIAFDHRTEGDIHMNKKDMDLKKGEKDSYNAYGDSQGDGTLEGAVYGLFAATDIPHPDGHSGVVFQKDDLVSIATTDRNGDASFLAITQAPGYTFNYQTGAIEKTSNGWAEQAPGNLYTGMGAAIGKESDIESFEGHTERGSSISLTDSRNELSSGYEKLSSNQGKDGTGDSSHSYPIENNEALNGNCWIGRPLIVNADGTQYYIKELTRSEGFELSVYGKDAAVSNKDAFQAGGNPSAEGNVSAGTIGVDRVKGINTFTVKSSGTINGYQIYAQNIPKGASFYTTKSQVVEDPSGTHTEYVIREENALAETEGAKVIINGASVPAKAGDIISLPNGDTATVTKVSEPEYDYTAARPDNALRYTIPTFQDKENTGDIAEDANAALKKASFKEPDESAPWMLIPVEGHTFEEQAKSLYEGMETAGLSAFNCLKIEEIKDGKAVIRYSYRVGTSIAASIYDEVLKILYIKKDIYFDINGTEIAGYLYVPYTQDQFADSTENSNGFVTYAKVRSGELSKKETVYLEDLSAITVTESPERTYWVYSEGEPIRNNDGSIKIIMVQEEVQVSPGYELKDMDTPVTAVYDGNCYTIEVGGEDGTTSTDYKITYTDDFVEGTYTTPGGYAGYYGTISVSPNMAGAGTYIETVMLRYDKNQLYSEGGTRQTKVSIEERPIMQKIKITKDISTNNEEAYEDNTYAETGHEDHFTENGGGTGANAAYLKNFRFKAYLKSNLERLYRAEDGTVTWQDRNGNTVDINTYRAAFPEKVQKLYTRVDYQTNPLSKDSNKATIANTQLYNYTSDLINPDQNPGYTAILEKTKQTVKDEAGNEREVSCNNYDKFFDAIEVANEDQWDRTDNNSSSFKPFAIIKKLLFGINGGEKEYPALHNNADIENKINTSDTAKDNALRSDHVRQFAITWYLDDEVAKLVKDNPAGEKESAAENETYSDEIYDKALSDAIKKAENYLKPFFIYDLDEIYSISWDSETDGGKDKDNSTLSADLGDAGAGYCYGISEYLPYGTYVAVEQQPFNKDLGDLFNKHYKTAAPKEIELPSVYEGGKSGSVQTPEVLSSYYHYNAADNVSQLSSKYHIRFNEEWPGEGGKDLKNYVIRAHNYLGDYELYQYGLDLNKLSGSSAGDPSGRGHFTITQGGNDPVKDYYNTMVDSETTGGNPGSHYLADDGNERKSTANGSTYETDGIEKIYRYGSVSEDKQTYDNVSFPSGDGEVYRDNVTVMEGMQTAYNGKYASMLVPWSVAEPADETADTVQNPDGTSSYKGYAYQKYRNTFYTSRLRIEKLDSETGENLLQDGALFALYAASREDGENTDGLVKFYEADTDIEGSKEFLEAMGASNIIQSEETWAGTVPAGTPICKEEEKVIFADQEGRRTGQFEAITTTRDGVQAKEGDLTSTSYQDQNTGYLVTPQSLGAGTYVLCEIKPPAGYARTKPVAIEIYSDQTTYYLDGDRDSRVAAAIYEDKNQEVLNPDTARIYIGNTPVRLEVSKIKDSDHTVTYKTDTRLEGTELDLKQKYGMENLEFAYKNGTYLSYAWYKGTIEYLQSRKDAGENVNLIYVDGVFAGYGLIERTLDTADDHNRYVSGAKMALYDAISISESGDSGDFGYNGVKVTRDRNNNVQSITVLKGHAGTTVEFLRKDSVFHPIGQDVKGSFLGENGDGTWTYETSDRADTNILYYSLSNLTVTESGTDGKLYGRDRNGNKVLVKNQNSIFVLKDGQPAFELTGGDLTTVKYSVTDKILSLSSGTTMYHLDQNGNRDAYVDSTTGMAFAKEGDKLLVWPVKISRTETGAVIAREKIKTWRIAAISADTDQEYITGTYNGNSLVKSMNPVLNGHGLPEYYQRSGETYKKGDPVYDIDGDFVRYKYDDLLKAFNNASYSVNNQTGMEDIGEEENTTDDKKLYHRQGESWVMENTWISGEKYPNDPFQSVMTAGQSDMLKRVIPGTYIMEEVTAPSGYTKGFPKGVTVKESRAEQKTEMEDEKIKVEIVKTDAASEQTCKIISDYQDGLTVTEPKGAYSYCQVPGAHLAIYKANRVYTTDSETYPKGYYLVKAEAAPAKWMVENKADNAPVTVTADWITDGTPKYFEEIPAGDYILEELEAVAGYVRKSMELTINATKEVQSFNLKNDHIKLEIFKYDTDRKGNKVPLSNKHPATLALYEAKTDTNGNILIENGKPVYDHTKPVDQWITDNLSEYTEETEINTSIMERLKALFGLKNNHSGFIPDFEAAYKEKGQELTSFTWHTRAGERTASLTSIIQVGNGEGIVETWNTDTGKTIRITIYRNVTNGSLDTNGQLPLIFEYQFNYKEFRGIKTYDTLEGMHRMDYLALNLEKNEKKIGAYVLVEEKTPSGYNAADPKAIVLTETGAVHRVSLENEEKFINVLKVVSDGTNQYTVEGAELALYRAGLAGDFVKDDTHMIETWISGADGRYTEEDQFNNDIIEGFQVGDIKPHRISKISNGIYYIAEVTPPAYMQKAQPVRIEVKGEKVPFYRITNIPTVGTLEINKKASDTREGLENGRFKITNKNTGVVWYITTGTDGTATLKDLPVGAVQPDGTINPYNYTVEEISPPDYYQISSGKKKFRFDGAESGEEVKYSCEILNNPTEIYFRKTDFNTRLAVKGAEIAIYEAGVIDGEYQKNGRAISIVRTQNDGFILKKKLKANQVYIMEEIKAPSGYAISKPVKFTVNKFGTGIQNVSNDFNVIKPAVENGTIEALTVTGRVPVKVYTILKDLDTGFELPAIIGTGDNQIITAMDGIIEGHLYDISEYTKYSDGKSEKTFKETRRIYFNEDSMYKLHSRTYLGTRQELSDKEGNVLASWAINEDNHDHTVINPVVKEIPIARVSSNVGANFAAVKAGSVMKYSISFTNPYNHPSDILVKADLTNGLEYLRSSDCGTEHNGMITWNLTDIAAYESGTMEMAVVVKDETGQARAWFETKVGAVSKRTILENPIVSDGSITIINKLTGTGEKQTDTFTCHVKFTDKDGSVLTGYQAYGGSCMGRIKGEGTITLAGDGTITFTKLPYGTRYEISQDISDDYVQETGIRSGEIQKSLQSAIFVNNRDNKLIRELLAAGGTYQLKETTVYSDKSSITTGIYEFTINDTGMIDNVDMEDKPVNLSFVKRDRDTRQVLSGGHYSFIDENNGEILFKFTIKDESVVIPPELVTPNHGYIFRENLPPQGYAIEKDIHIIADQSGIAEIVIMEDKQTEISITKVDEETGKLLTGGRFTIREKETGTVIETFSPVKMPYQLNGILIAGTTYELIEEEAPAGYSHSQNVEFTVPVTPQPINVIMRDRQTKVIIQKAVSSSSTPSEAVSQIPGCILQILNEDKTPAKAIRSENGVYAGDNLIFTTTDQSEILKGQMDAGKNYWLHEIKPASGYAYAEDVPFVVSQWGEEDSVIMFDDPTHVILSKKAITGIEELSGNHMSVVDNAGNVIDEWISGELPHEIIRKLIAGETYHFIENKPADGYAYGDNVSFTVRKAGGIDLVEMRNDKTKIEIKKINTSGEILKGASLQILDQQKNVVIPEFISTDEVIDITGKLIAGRTYYLHEVNAPMGYFRSSDIAFTVPKEAKLLEITMTDPKRPDIDSGKMIIQKIDAETGLGIESVEFSIYQSDGELYLAVKTDKDGYVKFDMPQNGTYTYKETKSAPGYLATDHTYSFTIKNGEVSENSIVSVVNYLSPEVQIQKADAKTMKRLAGAELVIRNADGKAVFHGVTDGTGMLSYYPLRSGQYTVHEVKAPVGYKKTDTFLTILVAEDGTVTGDFTLLNRSKRGEKKGIITATYQSSLKGLGISNQEGKRFWNWLDRLPGTGDTGLAGRWLIYFLLAGIVTLIVIIRRKNI
ncbi:SpaA isopeptide-forming pilin-related protein [Clostridium boliviensis]|uniref:SpaA isopeptide-forming pilin-related protein n=2 Tax=Bacillota TaxID=1239 RepID=A0ABU4GPC1_9CLOT|nr:SpaA isopeptide-forming pilin-related protein [Clostridium boliviensis]MDW2798763.1 SpaA isopeptide-forming pilin-related protein [Clostridium boliviensis]